MKRPHMFLLTIQKGDANTPSYILFNDFEKAKERFLKEKQDYINTLDVSDWEKQIIAGSLPDTINTITYCPEDLEEEDYILSDINTPFDDTDYYEHEIISFCEIDFWMELIMIPIQSWNGNVNE